MTRTEEERFTAEDEHEEDKELPPPWHKQITLRAAITSLILSFVFTVIVTKLTLTTGLVPPRNVSAGLLGFAIVRTWTALLEKCGALKQPYTQQENTVIQTSVVASSGIAFSGGTCSYLLAMISKVAAQADAGNTPENVKNFSFSWIFWYLFSVSFAGLFSIVPLRKMMILKYKLTYPSGTATAYLINKFHDRKGAKLAKKQVMALFQSSCFSFLFAFFQWFFTAAGGCGFSNFPTFGFQAFKQKFYFDFATTYVGVGMICPYMVNISLLIGGIISWGILWPFIESKKGDWYSAHLSPTSLHGIQGYRVFLAIALMLGDGLFHILHMMLLTLKSLVERNPKKIVRNQTADEYNTRQDYDDDEKEKATYFLKEQLPTSVAIAGYLIFAILCTFVVPRIFPQLKWYHILVAYALAPFLAFCNAYGCGLTDFSLASNYGKICIFTFSSWVGLNNGEVVAGLAACGVMMSILSTASDLMEDFKTGYLTFSSPRAMFISQLYGTTTGCIMSPLVFWFFNNAYNVGDLHGAYPAPIALMYRGIALLGVEGFSSLPRNCAKLAIGFFIVAMVINLIAVVLKKFETKYGVYRFVVNPMCMAIPFYLGAYFTIDMCIGSLILFIWGRKNRKQAKELRPAIASGLICGESLWAIPAVALSLAGVHAPICMKFLSATVNKRVDGFLAG